MRIILRSRTQLMLCGLVIAVLAIVGLAQSRAAGPAPQAAGEPDGQRDFDFEIGSWKTQLRRLASPLTGSTTWVEYEGTSIVRKVWGGRANLVELDVAGSSGRIEGLSLRLYNPQTRQWSLNFASARNGMMTPPVTGGFKDGRGEFYGQESMDGRPIFVRFVITVLGPDSCRFEQSFSNDGGKSWEVNWIAIDTRLPDAEGGRP